MCQTPCAEETANIEIKSSERESGHIFDVSSIEALKKYIVYIVEQRWVADEECRRISKPFKE
jgi:putative IMPACT (imprinted ancient) family translation regulator